MISGREIGRPEEINGESNGSGETEGSQWLIGWLVLRVPSGGLVVARLTAQVAVMPRSSDRVARSHGVAGGVRDRAAVGSTGVGVVAATADRIR